MLKPPARSFAYGEVEDYTVNIGTPAIAGFAAIQTGLLLETKIHF
jgi:hypothetical protein